MVRVMLKTVFRSFDLHYLIDKYRPGLERFADPAARLVV